MTHLVRCSSALIAILAVAALTPDAGQAQEELSRSLSRLPAVFGKAEVYQRKGNEDVYRVARRYSVSASAIHNANAGDLRAGDELLLIPTEHIAPLNLTDGIVVNLTERGLYLFRAGEPVRYFPVAIGRRGWETPTGEFTIANKAKNPTWFPPSWALEEEPVPPGPGNPLGDRWMGLSARGYGIHATNSPWTVGHYASHGCMRMYPEHAHDLYEMVRVGTPAIIVYRRIVVGYRQETASVYMAHHPDPYDAGEVRPEDALRELREYGLDTVADAEAIAEALERPTGVPIPVVGSPTRVLVNGVPVRFALGPTRAGADWLVPAGPLARAMGAQIELGARRDYFLLTRGGDRIFLVPGSVEALVNGQSVRLEAAPQLAAGYPMVPLRSTVAALSGSVGWDEAAQTILVWDGWVKTRSPEVAP